MIIQNDLNLKPGEPCPRCQPGIIEKMVNSLVCSYCGRIFEQLGQTFQELPDGAMFQDSSDRRPGEIYVKGQPPAYISDNPREIPPNAYKLSDPVRYSRFGWARLVTPLSQIEVMILRFIWDGGPARLDYSGDKAGVIFLDEGEFIPFDDLGFNREYGFYQLSAFPGVENGAGE
jgi:hypothetical protein